MTNGLPNPTLNLCAVNACLQAVANADDVRDLVMRHQGEKKLSQLERTLQHMWGAPCPAKNDAVSLEVVR